MTITYQKFLMLGAIITFAILGSAYLLEYGLKLEPCSLCLLQRYTLWVVALFFLTGAIHNCKGIGRIFYYFGIFIFGVIGILLSARHVWIQHSPPDIVATCTAGLQQMLNFKPALEILKEVILAPGECARIDFSFLSLSLPIWSLLGFTILVVFDVMMVCLQTKRRI